MVVRLGFQHRHTPCGEPNCHDRRSVFDTLMNGGAKPSTALDELIGGHVMELMAQSFGGQ